MKRTATLGAVLAAAALAASLVPVSAQARDARRSDPVTITVDSISPSTPVFSKQPRPLTFSLTVTNTTSSDLSGVRIDLERGSPIASQQALDAALADPTPPTVPDATPAPTRPVLFDLPAGGRMQVIFQTTSGEPIGPGLCLCHEAAVYPLFFSAHTVKNGVDTLLGVGATYVPSIWDATGKRLHVSWVWPLLERPHRLAGDTEFTDDLLATSVDTGRLSRALAVAEEVAAQPDSPIPLTLLIDPELLDELAVMADTKTPYTVRSGDQKPVPGTGQHAAQAWLQRLANLLLTHPEVLVRLTPYGDPDVQSLGERGMNWDSTPATTDMTARVGAALADRALDSTVAWPVGGISKHTLRLLARHGVSTLILNSTAVTLRSTDGVPPGLTHLAGIDHGNVVAALTSSAIESRIAKVMTVNSASAGLLPQIIAELAIRVAEQPRTDQQITLTPPRYVDPNVDAAVRTIMDTSESTFATPVSLRDAVSSDLVSNGRSRLARVPTASGAEVSSALDAAEYSASKQAAIASLIDKADVRGQAFQNDLRVAIQRCESSAWRDPANQATGQTYADQLTKSVDGVLDGVRIVKTSGSYTLASNSSPIPVTVDNELPYAVWVRISLTPEFGVRGFRYKDIGKQPVEADQQHTFKIPTTLDYNGRIRISATLTTPSHYQLGSPVSLRVRSTALGVVGVVITIVAGVVLGLALLWRLTKRLRGRRRPTRRASAVVPEAL